jgi:predicted RNA binding protein YcfA (HicA-like mRNA interferase family)
MPSDVRFSELRRYLEGHGWVLVRISGSHHIFGKAGERAFPVPVHGGKVKHGYVREAEERCGGA